MNRFILSLSTVISGILFERIEVGSIIIRARPSGPSSLQKLEKCCRSGTIKKFIPQIFFGKAVERVLEAGEFRLALSIYLYPDKQSKEGNYKIKMHSFI